MSFLKWLWSLIFPAKTMSTQSPTTAPIDVGITTDVGAVAGTVTTAMKVVAQIQSELNTQPMIDAKVRQEKQDRLDAINRAIADRDLEAIEKLSSP